MDLWDLTDYLYKVCMSCKENLFFNKFSSYQNSLRNSTCKVCKNKQSKEYRESHVEECIRYREKIKERSKNSSREYYLNNRDKIISRTLEWQRNNKDKVREKRKRYEASHAEEIRRRNKEYRENNKETVAETVRKSREKRKEKIKEYHKNRNKIPEVREAINKRQREWRARNPEMRAARAASRTLGMALRKRSLRKTAKTEEMIGLPFEMFKEYIADLFWPGMTWDNYGGKTGWHIDHILPVVSFDLTAEEGQRKVNRYDNLQPLWPDDNVSKQGRLNWSPLESKHELPDRLRYLVRDALFPTAFV